MPAVTALAFLFFTLAVPLASNAADDLYIFVSLTKGEHSKDSNSKRTTITVEGDKIVYEVTYHGFRSSRMKPVRKEYHVTGEEVARLRKVIEGHNLLVSDSLDYPSERPMYRYFEISLDLRLDGKKSLVEITGSSRAAKIKDEKLYQNSRALLKEIFRIINVRDKEIDFTDDLLLDQPID